MNDSPGFLAQALLRGGRLQEAVGMLDRAANGGDAVAAFQLATWLLIGHHVPRDLGRARQLLGTARVIGHVDAALIEIALMANGAGGEGDWLGACALLTAAAQSDPVAAAQLAILDTLDIDDSGAPLTRPVPEYLADDRVVRFVGFASPAECAQIATAAADLLTPAMVVDPRTGRQIAHPVRSSHEAVIGPMRENLVIQAINRRIAAASKTLTAQGEPLTVLRYAPGQQFRLHHDSIAGARNQRTMTLLVYLNDGYEGGETTFPDRKLTIVPRAGDAILFHNSLDGKTDPRARHAGLPVRHGIKWLATRWIRERPFDPWAGPETA